MQKLTEVYAAKAKKDLAAASVEMENVFKQIAESKSELEQVRCKIATTQSLYEEALDKSTRIWNGFTERIQRARNTLKDIEAQSDVVDSELSRKQNQLLHIQQLLSDTANRVKESKTNSLVGQVVDVLYSELDSVLRDKGFAEEALKAIESKQSAIQDHIRDMTGTEESLVTKVNELNSVSKMLERKYEEMSRIETILKEIAQREYDSRILFDRLNKDYREMYLLSKQ